MPLGQKLARPNGGIVTKLSHINICSTDTKLQNIKYNSIGVCRDSQFLNFNFILIRGKDKFRFAFGAERYLAF